MWRIVIKAKLIDGKVMSIALKDLSLEELQEKNFNDPAYVTDMFKMVVVKDQGVEALELIRNVFVVYNNLEKMKNAN